MSQSALITGVSGLAGRPLAEELIADGWQVDGTVRSRRAELSGLTEHQLEIDDCESLTELIARLRPSVIFHLAAVVDTVTTPSVMHLHRTNTIGTVAVLEAMRAAKSKATLLYASSSFAYGAVPSDRAVREDQPLRPITPYGASKAASETLVEQFARETGTRTVITRAFQHTGPRHVGVYALADWASQIAQIEAGPGEGAIHCGNIDVERDYLDVRDVASAYFAAATEGRAGETYNVCSGVPRTMRSLLEGLIAAFDADVEIEVDPTRVRKIDQKTFYGDPAKLMADTGWVPHYEIEQTLADLASFWREQVGSDGLEAD